MSAKKIFIEFVENNDWEGETWSFWIPQEGNEDAIAKLTEIIVDDDSYQIGDKPLEDEKQLDFLIERTKDETGYMARHHKLSGLLKIPKKKDAAAIRESLYKGGICALVKAPRKAKAATKAKAKKQKPKKRSKR